MKPLDFLSIGSFTTGIEGLFLVGAGRRGGGFLACVASGVLAGGDVAKYLESPQELNEFRKPIIPENRLLRPSGADCAV
jgi:hypothetical protein